MLFLYLHVWLFRWPFDVAVVVACWYEVVIWEDDALSRYLERNVSIGAIEEMAIKLIMQRHKRVDLEREVRECGVPVIVRLLDCCLDPVKKIRWRRTQDNLYDLVLLCIWKAILGSSFRWVFYEILYNIVKDISPEELEQYRRDPVDWKINVFARRRRGSDSFIKE